MKDSTAKRTENRNLRHLSLVIFICIFFAWPGFHVQAASPDKWTSLKQDFAGDDQVDRLIFVKYRSRSRADFFMYRKTDRGSWKKLFRCTAWVGRKGIGKKKEGDRKTPTGVFGFTFAFGIRKNPGTVLDYIRLNPHLYWSLRKKDYNRLVDSRKARGVYGEHLIRYRPQYNYAINIDYNPDNLYGKGSAIFLHCRGKRPYTAGCVAIPQNYMKKVLKNATDKMKICIFKK